jgi:tartrate dehydrogenase/decarboxylase/D-malate dehydrogenase
MMSANWKDQIGRRAAIYFGAVGKPAQRPDHISVGDSLCTIRGKFNQCVNFSSVWLKPGVPSPLTVRKAVNIDAS